MDCLRVFGGVEDEDEGSCSAAAAPVLADAAREAASCFLSFVAAAAPK